MYRIYRKIVNSFQGDFLILSKVVCFRRNLKGQFQGVSLMIREGSHVCTGHTSFCRFCHIQAQTVCRYMYKILPLSRMKSTEMLHKKNLYTKLSKSHLCINEPHSEKTGLRGFRPGPTQTSLYSHRRWLET